MKKILLLLTAIAGLATLSQAQEFGFQQGDVLLEGNVSFNTTRINNGFDWRVNTLGINPKAGYFLTKKWALGLDLEYQLEKIRLLGGAEETTNKGQRYSFGAFGRYYFLELGSRFKTFTELGGYYGFDRNDGWNFDYEKANRFGVNAGIGANFFITPKVAIGYTFADLISFTSEKADLPDAERVERFGLNINSFNNFLQSGAFSLTFKL